MWPTGEEGNRKERHDKHFERNAREFSARDDDRWEYAISNESPPALSGRAAGNARSRRSVFNAVLDQVDDERDDIEDSCQKDGAKRNAEPVAFA